MPLDRDPSRWQRGQQQVVDPPEGLGEQARDCDFGELERDIASMAHHPRADLDPLFPQCGERPMFDLLRQRQCLLWVISGHRGLAPWTSASSQERT